MLAACGPPPDEEEGWGLASAPGGSWRRAGSSTWAPSGRVPASREEHDEFYTLQPTPHYLA